MFIIIIKGPAAVGKSYIANHLIRQLKKRCKLGSVDADCITHFMINCRFSPQKLSIKYKILAATIGEMAIHDYNLIIQDLFRRQEDIDNILTFARRFTKDILVVHLTATEKILIGREKKRKKTEHINVESLLDRRVLSEKVRVKDEVVIDTSNQTPSSIVRTILENLSISLD